MNTTLSKKEIRQNLELALNEAIEKIEGSESSKKIRKKVKKLSKSIAGKVKVDLKKKMRKASKRDHKEMRAKLNGYLIETVPEKTHPVSE